MADEEIDKARAEARLGNARTEALAVYEVVRRRANVLSAALARLPSHEDIKLGRSPGNYSGGGARADFPTADAWDALDKSLSNFKADIMMMREMNELVAAATVAASLGKPDK